MATAPTRVAIVGAQEFHFLVQEHPSFALSVMKVMAERLRRNNADAVAGRDHGSSGAPLPPPTPRPA